MEVALHLRPGVTNEIVNDRATRAVHLRDPCRELRQKVHAAEVVMKTLPQKPYKLVHYFAPGVYARELHIPAQTVLTGEIHKYQQFNILSKGTISVLLEDGVRRLEAPFATVSPAGTKRIAYAHTDCIWTTVLGTNETDISKIEAHFVAKTEQEWLDFCDSLSETEV